MSSAGSPERDQSLAPEVPTSHKSLCTIQLQTYTKAHTGKLKKKEKQKKESVKTKEMEFIFNANTNNYVLIMNQILSKYSLEKQLKATVRHCFQMKMQIPGENKNQARDVDNAEEFLEVQNKIIHRQSNKPITIYVDMLKIEAKAKKIKADNDEDDEDENDDEGNETDDNGLTKTEAQEARFHRLLQKEHGNINNNSLTIIDEENGMPVHLSNIAADVWVRALMDETPGVTVRVPPANDPLFKSSKIIPKLTRTGGRTHSTSMSESADSFPIDGMTMLGHLATMFTSISNLTNSRSRTPPPSTASMTTAVTSPIKNTPTKLPRFLKYAEENLGVENATSHQYALQRARYGPDILSRVADAKLTDLGIPDGDVIRLKEAAPSWWNGPDAKRKPSESTLDVSDNEPPRKRIRFERRGKDGSFYTLVGTGMYRVVDDKDLPESPYEWFYFCDIARTLVPFPPRYVPILESELDDQDM